MALLMKLWQLGPAMLFAAVGAGITWILHRKVSRMEEKRMENDVREALAVNHAVLQKEQAAKTDEDADAALDAASDASDRL